jgi:hypothetical protein
MGLAAHRAWACEVSTTAQARRAPHGHDGRAAMSPLPALATSNRAQILDRLWLREEGRAVLMARSAAIQATLSGLDAGATTKFRTVPRRPVPGSSHAATLCHWKGQKRQNALSREVIESKGQKEEILHTKARGY